MALHVSLWTLTHGVLQVHVRQVKVSGLRRTKNDIVVEQVKEILHAGSLSILSPSLLSFLSLLSLSLSLSPLPSGEGGSAGRQSAVCADGESHVNGETELTQHLQVHQPQVGEGNNVWGWGRRRRLYHPL